MDLPAFRRGLELVSADLNKLSNAIRAASVTSVIGGRFSRTPGGTTIIINDQVRGGGGGGPVCQYFQVTDATEDNTLKVVVAQNQIANRWPLNMGPGTDPFELEITGNAYIYAAIYWDIATLTIGSDSTAITILQSNDLLPNTATMQYILVATVTVGGSPEAITSIVNVCSQPQPNPCTLDWSS
jgi:hypothetical protein